MTKPFQAYLFPRLSKWRKYHHLPHELLWGLNEARLVKRLYSLVQWTVRKIRAWYHQYTQVTLYSLFWARVGRVWETWCGSSSPLSPCWCPLDLTYGPVIKLTSRRDHPHQVTNMLNAFPSSLYLKGYLSLTFTSPSCHSPNFWLPFPSKFPEELSRNSVSTPLLPIYIKLASPTTSLKLLWFNYQ